MPAHPLELLAPTAHADAAALQHGFVRRVSLSLPGFVVSPVSCGASCKPLPRVMPFLFQGAIFESAIMSLDDRVGADRSCLGCGAKFASSPPNSSRMLSLSDSSPTLATTKGHQQ
jgi:hypothetical protein